MKKLVAVLFIIFSITTNSYAHKVTTWEKVFLLALSTTYGPTHITTVLPAEFTTDSTKSTSSKKSKKKASLERFVADNIDNIAIDIAKGSGEYIEAYAELSEFPDNNKEQLFQNLKANFKIIFPSLSVDHKHVISEINRISNIEPFV
ncbi:MAG: DUF3015 domain-containing protein [Desulfobacterales bacterium]|nr:DUF3015 domain-containing protein [Desulfobacterales bacterium]